MVGSWPSISRGSEGIGRSDDRESTKQRVPHLIPLEPAPDHPVQSSACSSDRPNSRSLG